MGEADPTRAAGPAAIAAHGSRPERIGRFEVTGVLGEGGMGVVYEARDPDLDRSVAVKLIHEQDAQHAIRLLREAQALARLQHPNVVAVHEVGRHDEQVFVAMERVDGVSLDRLDPKPADWREVLRLFIQAGRGLAAAHDKGLVHRDVKPHNLLVDRVGRVLVADFGLVRLADAPTAGPGATAEPEPPPVISPTATTVEDSGEDPVPAAVTPGAGALGSALTRANAYMGTPRYMAPEQHERRPATAASDQFSFCVALWEALCGEHPFGRDPAVTWAAAVTGNHRRPAPRGKAPGWLIAALDRGLAQDPSKRHPSMTALVDLLERTPVRRRRILLAAAGLVIVGAATAIGTTLTRSSHAGVSCASAGDAFALVWTEDARAQMTRAFTPARPHGSSSAHLVAARMDDYGARWRAARVAACADTHERGQQSPELLDRRMACLDQELAEVSGVLDVLGSADGEVVDRAVEAVGSLPSPERCGTQLATVMPDPDDPRAEAIRRDQARLAELFTRGAMPEARTLVTELRERAEALGHPRIRAQILLRYAKVSEASLPADTLDAVLRQALNDAARAGDRDAEAEAQIWMLRQAYLRNDAKAIDAVLPIAAATVSRDGVTTNIRRMLATNEGEAYRVLGRFDEALAACDRLAAIEEPPQQDAADCRCNTLTAAVRIDLAADACGQAVKANELAYGPDHHYVAGSLMSQGQVEMQRGRYAEALPLYQRAHRILETVYPPDSGWVLMSNTGLANVYVTLRRYDEARAMVERSLAVRRRKNEKPSRELALDLALLAEVQIASGQVDEGLRQFDAAVTMHAEAVGDQHPLQVEMVGYRAETYYAAGRWQAAGDGFATCAELARAAFGEHHPISAACLGGRAATLVELGRHRQALPVADEAIAQLTGIEADPQVHATAHFARARALLATGQRKAGAAALETALSFYRSGDPEDRDFAKAQQLQASQP